MADRQPDPIDKEDHEYIVFYRVFASNEELKATLRNIVEDEPINVKRRMEEFIAGATPGEMIQEIVDQITDTGYCCWTVSPK